MKRRVLTVGAIIMLLAVALLIAAPMALADPAGCTQNYAGSVANPPEGADPIICEGKFCVDGVGVNPSGAFGYVDHVDYATQVYIACVV